MGITKKYRPRRKLTKKKPFKKTQKRSLRRKQSLRRKRTLRRKRSLRGGLKFQPSPIRQPNGNIQQQLDALQQQLDRARQEQEFNAMSPAEKLHYIIEKNTLSGLPELLENPNNRDILNTPTEQGVYPLPFFVEKEPNMVIMQKIQEYVDNESIEPFDYSIEANKDALISLIREGNSSLLGKLLKFRDAIGVNTVLKDGKTMLDFAIESRNVSIIESLLERGASSNDHQKKQINELIKKKPYFIRDRLENLLQQPRT